MEEVLARLRSRAGDTSFLYGTYHNHTIWSDGLYTPEELIEKALELGFAEVGITDHYYTLKGEVNCVIDDQLDEYRGALTELGERYHDRIRVLAGIEIDTSFFNPKRQDLPFERLSRFHYVLFEYVGHEILGGYSLHDVVDARRRLSCNAGLAHPDMRNLIAQYGARDLVQTLAENGIFIDVCGSMRNAVLTPYTGGGITRKFTLNIEDLGDEFVTAALEFGLEFVPSSDTHQNGATDSLAATLNAVWAIERYGFSRKRF